MAQDYLRRRAVRTLSTTDPVPGSLDLDRGAFLPMETPGAVTRSEMQWCVQCGRVDSWARRNRDTCIRCFLKQLEEEHPDPMVEWAATASKYIDKVPRILRSPLSWEYGSQTPTRVLIALVLHVFYIRLRWWFITYEDLYPQIAMPIFGRSRELCVTADIVVKKMGLYCACRTYHALQPLTVMWHRRSMWFPSFLMSMLSDAALWLCIVYISFFSRFIPQRHWRPAALQHAWEHRCDGSPMEILLDTRAYGEQGPGDAAYFYRRGSTSPFARLELDGEWQSPEQEVFTFFVVSTELDQRGSSLDVLTYNYTDGANTIVGRCASSSEPSSPAQFCATGRVTASASSDYDYDFHTSTGPNTRVRRTSRGWTFPGEQRPALQVHTVNLADDTLADLVFETAVVNPTDCTQLKLCVARDSETLDAEVLFPLSNVLLHQMMYAQTCSAPPPPRTWSKFFKSMWSYAVEFA